MSNLFYRNPRIIVLTIALIIVGGLSSYYVLPRMEDPLLTERVAMITTRFPGADAERVESLVTEKIEEEFQEIDEIKELRSISRAGISTLTIELRDDIYQVDSVWSRVRDKLDDSAALLPSDASEPEFEQVEVKAYALIVGLIWDREDDANYAILRRQAEQLKDQLLAVPGTEEVDLFGDPEEEIVVEIESDRLTALGLTTSHVSDQIRDSDSKRSAGQLRSAEDLLIEVDGELDSLARIEQTPIHFGDSERFVRLSDVARVGKGIKQPATDVALIGGKPGIALGVLVRPAVRVDHWSIAAERKLSAFGERISIGTRIEPIFRQNAYVTTRLAELLRNLLLGGVAVVVVIFVMMGWRSALIVGSALPLAALMVLTGMRILEIPIHQMSVTGLIIALGLLIDNAIVIVDEVNGSLAGGATPDRAVADSVSHLALPLAGSTLTTAFAFAPIALMPGPAGEFVGSIAVSVILAIASSFFLAMTVIPALAAMIQPEQTSDRRLGWWHNGLKLPGVLPIYRTTLDKIFSRPWIGILAGVFLPVIGFLQFGKLPEQFFPPADRDQFHLELELPSTSSLGQTLATAGQIRERLLADENVEAVSWFIGESAPTFYYNVIPRRRNTPGYAQAIVQLRSGTDPLPVIRRIQPKLQVEFPESRVLARQLEQGPPFDAPVEIRLFGPDLQVLRRLGDRVRFELGELNHVVATRSDLSETVAKLSIQVDEEEARLAGFSHAEIASQLHNTLEGSVGGSILEQTEELPVRVRVAGSARAQIESIASLRLVDRTRSARGIDQGTPLTSIGRFSLTPQSASIPRFNGQRMNEVQGYVTAGILPATVVTRLRERLDRSGFRLPAGYTLEMGGEAAKRDDAVTNLMASVGILMVLMVATLVLSFKSFRIAGLIGIVAVLSVGLGVGALWVFGYPFGFMAIVGTMGLIGVAINDTIVVLAAIREDDRARIGDPLAVSRVVVRSTRHVVATSLTTMAGFIPLLLAGGGFWPPLAVTIAGGVGGATILALYFAPSAYVLVLCRRCGRQSVGTRTDCVDPAVSQVRIDAKRVDQRVPA